ncbi:MAG: gliding motility-associated C-terminal domain-containing protein [Bacteroidota bacterium]
MKQIMDVKPYFLVLLLFACNASAQELCEGNLGDNIFTEGNFGSGQPNILLPNPNIAPGYTYTVNVPPNDGFYTVTNSTMNWQDLWPSWLRIQDNSNDPFGYMMIVNASFSPGIFFEQTIDNLCGDTDYEFSADIINLIRSNMNGHIRPNVSFLLNGDLQFSTGDIPQTDDWITYGFTFRTEPGQTELTLTLRNNAPGGIGNDLGLDNISFRACGPSAFIDTDRTIFLCESDNEPASITADINVESFSIQWQISLDGINWTSIPGQTDNVFFHDNFDPGSYFYRYLSATSVVNLDNFKCRIISDVIKIEVLPLEYSLKDTICEATPYRFGEDILTSPGTYVGDFVSQRGCDSIVTLDLAIIGNDLSFDLLETDPACVGDETGSIEVVDLSGDRPPLTYLLEGEEVSGPPFNGLGEGTYLVEILDRYQCSAVATATLNVPNAFFINVGNDITLEFGEVSRNIRVNGSEAPFAVSWSPADFLECSDCLLNRATGATNISYVVTAENAGGCIATDTLNVFVNANEVNIFIPNVFSPNGDGINDYFQLFSYAQAVSEIESMAIYDRWGGLMYEGKNFQPNIEQLGWDGRNQDEFVLTGVYLYVFNVRLIDGRLIQKTGSITVVY